MKPSILRYGVYLPFLLLAACDQQTIDVLSKVSSAAQDQHVQSAVASAHQALRSPDSYSLDEERGYGRANAALVFGVDPLLPDPDLQAYVNKVGRWIALQSGRPDIPWTFGVTHSADVNAFAMPGGYIIISQGMLQRLNSEAELAVVLGHEIVHVEERHNLKAMQHQALKTTGMEIAAYGAEGNATAQQLLAASRLGMGAFFASSDRGDETAADRKGVVLAARAGYNPYAMVSVLTMLGDLPPGDPGTAQWFKGHPRPSDRLAAINAAMDGHMEAYQNGINNTPDFNRYVGKLKVKS